MTINEMRSFINNGYRDGHSTPSLKLDLAGVARVTHNVVLAHGLAVQAIRASGNRSTRVGIADVPFTITPVLETQPYIQAARRAMREENASMLTAIMEGRYTDKYLKRLGPAAPQYTPEEMVCREFRSPIDRLRTYQKPFRQHGRIALIRLDELVAEFILCRTHVGREVDIQTDEIHR
jgi:beta-glucosidase